MLTTLPMTYTLYGRVRPTRPRLPRRRIVEKPMRRFVLTLIVLAATGAASGSTALAAPLDGLVASGLASAGGASGGYVLDTTTGRTLAAVRADTPRIPASVEKLYTTSTALLRFGPQATLDTTVLGDGELDDAGVWRGDLYLRGSGDPTFGSAAFARRAYGLSTSVGTLAQRVADAGVMRVTGRVYGDESWLDRLRGGPASGFALDYDIGGPLGGLLFNRGLAREDGSALQTMPAKFAATQLTNELRRIGVRVAAQRRRRHRRRRTPTSSPSVASPTIATLIRLTLAAVRQPAGRDAAEERRRALRHGRLDDRRRRGRAQHRRAAGASRRGSPTAPASRARTGPRRARSSRC